MNRPLVLAAALLLAAPSMDAIMQLLAHFQGGMVLSAFEFFSEAALSKVLAHTGLERPLAETSPYYALLEFENPEDAAQDQAMALFAHSLEQGWALDGIISQNEEQRRNLWRLREDISETIARWSPYKNDLSVRVSRVPAFLQAIDAIVGQHYPDFEIIWFGHIGDGNVHLNILKPDAMAQADFYQRCHHVSELVFAVVRDYGGSVSAEHGVGLLKKDHLHYSRSTAELALLAAIKQVFDPQGIMNPGKMLAAPQKP